MRYLEGSAVLSDGNRYAMRFQSESDDDEYNRKMIVKGIMNRAVHDGLDQEFEVEFKVYEE